MAKKRAKSKKSIFSKKVKTEDRGSLSPTHGESNNTTPNNVRKKNPSKRPKTDSKDNPKPKEKVCCHKIGISWLLTFTMTYVYYNRLKICDDIFNRLTVLFLGVGAGGYSIHNTVTM